MIISPLGQDDKMIWKGTPLGLFTVKSAYHMEMQRISQERGECSGEYGGGMVWKAIWDLKALPVLRNFCWKVSNNLLPNMENLFGKKIVPNPFIAYGGTLLRKLSGRNAVEEFRN
jgi:hypothetical protein